MWKTPVLGGCVRGGGRAAWSSLLALALAPAAVAQTPSAPAAPDSSAGPAIVTADVKPGAASPAEAIVPVGCSSCGTGGSWLGESFSAGNTSGCNTCVPGRTTDCGCCNASGPLGRLFCGLDEAICCPDPCYEPRWIAAANSAMFMDSPRPVNQTTLSWTNVENINRPDRAEFIWAKIGGKGPKGNPALGLSETNMHYNDLLLRVEAAANPKFSVVIDAFIYRAVQGDVNQHFAGFGDLSIATKSVLIDSEMLLTTFQFKTYIPSGNSSKGLGTGHVSLEPSLISALKLTNDTYLQAQIAEWIPLGGDADQEGAILHYHVSLNRVWWRPTPNVQVIGSAELNGYHVQDGLRTEPITVPPGGAFAVASASGDAIYTSGAGFRVVFCDKVDFGFGAVFAITKQSFGDQTYRTELRVRY